ncbi:hypothetical protein BDB00DRAFT_741753, partial [Zychaea mexicana]|uniref:uncharacterized protein n=1 Tax=Zychaea mexicana TaxID=64656 RepID=UPI0022FEFC71
LFARYVAALSASSISKCPQLAARASGPAGAYDLRPDDIKVIGAMGDSIMAGYGLEGINDGRGGSGLLNLSAITEYRGKSWAIGGDDGQVTVANLVKHYNSSLEGPAVGKHLLSLCPGMKHEIYYPNIDILNAAISGAIAKTLNAELDYLISRMKELPNVNFQTDWKMITIQIGSNDQCKSCSDDESADVTPDAYAGYVEAAIERIRKEVPRVLVNLVGTFNVSGLYDLTMGQDYCRPFLNDPDWILNRILCSCFRGSEKDRAYMDVLSVQYNEKLYKIYEKYKIQQSEGFAITYTPARLNVNGFPLETLSNIDCFHPGKLAHEWIAKIYCPTEDDRI